MKTLIDMCLFLILSGLGAAATAYMHPNAPRPGETAALDEFAISLSEIPDPGRVLWLDARSESEYLGGHIPDALLVNLESWQQGLDRVFKAWEPGRPVVVYCSSASCHTSAQVAARLRREFEVNSIYHLREGWEGWLQSGKPIEVSGVSYEGSL
jgi:rhodanese-related sulfurtransferase